MKLLVWLTHRYPAAFGLEWVETEELFTTNNPHRYDLRPVRMLSGGYVPLGWTPDEAEELCHCGAVVDRSVERNRGMCTFCDDVRCDSFPGECGRSG